MTVKEEWWTGPANPKTIEAYCQWVIEEFNGSLVESGHQFTGDAYLIEVTKLAGTEDGYRPVNPHTGIDGGDAENQEVILHV